MQSPTVINRHFKKHFTNQTHQVKDSKSIEKSNKHLQECASIIYVIVRTLKVKRCKLLDYSVNLNKFFTHKN